MAFGISKDPDAAREPGIVACAGSNVVIGGDMALAGLPGAVEDVSKDTETPAGKAAFETNETNRPGARDRRRAGRLVPCPQGGSGGEKQSKQQAQDREIVLLHSFPRVRSVVQPLEGTS
ncbi:MAG: hypothetical protein U1F54_17195 [Burkholderiales bacterium]